MHYNTIALVSFVCILIADITQRVTLALSIYGVNSTVALVLHSIAAIVFLKFAFGLQSKDKVPQNSCLNILTDC